MTHKVATSFGMEIPDGSSPLDAFIGFDTGQDIIGEPMKAYLP
jgi:hypothetical protein